MVQERSSGAKANFEEEDEKEEEEQEEEGEEEEEQEESDALQYLVSWDYCPHCCSVCISQTARVSCRERRCSYLSILGSAEDGEKFPVVRFCAPNQIVCRLNIAGEWADSVEQLLSSVIKLPQHILGL